MTVDRNAWNQQITDEFRANAGKVGGRFEGRTLLLLHDIGARSGIVRIHPLAYQPVGESFAIFASKAGGPTNPDWYHNLLAHPRVSVEVGTETVEVQARVVTGEERERIWSHQKEAFPNFAEYERLTTREIPVVLLERVS
jgi:deazaflavin-dependent oxidoreductase (nitroreductase family)